MSADTKVRPKGFTGPMLHIENPQPYDWHCWRREAHGDVWVGFFKTTEDAIEWVKKQTASKFVINNVPPTTSRRYMTGNYTWGQLADGTTVVPNPLTRATPLPKRRREPSAPVRRESTWSAPSRPLVKPKAAPKPKTAEEKALAAAAQKRVEVLKQDEARDVAAGKIENV